MFINLFLTRALEQICGKSKCTKINVLTNEHKKSQNFTYLSYLDLGLEIIEVSNCQCK